MPLIFNRLRLELPRLLRSQLQGYYIGLMELADCRLYGMPPKLMNTQLEQGTPYQAMPPGTNLLALDGWTKGDSRQAFNIGNGRNVIDLETSVEKHCARTRESRRPTICRVSGSSSPEIIS